MVIGRKTNINTKLLKTKPCPPPNKNTICYLKDSSNISSIVSASSDIINKI